MYHSLERIRIHTTKHGTREYRGTSFTIDISQGTGTGTTKSATETVREVTTGGVFVMFG